MLHCPTVQGIAPSGGGRIVWLLFDELSYDQAFDHRFPGLAMPAFDKLKSESVSFSDLQPAGYHTERVIPSFFLGHVVNDIRSNLDGEPMVQLAGRKGLASLRCPRHALRRCPAPGLDHRGRRLVQPLLPHSRGNPQLLFLEDGRRPMDGNHPGSILPWRMRWRRWLK